MLLVKGLKETEALWPDIRLAYGWVHEAAQILANHRGLAAEIIRTEYQRLLKQMRAQASAAASPFLSEAVEQFLKVTDSYWPGLFRCYEIADLPRTNNDLEHLFGSARYHERRATGRKVASPCMLVRGSARLPALTAHALAAITPEQLSPRDLAQWRTLRAALETRHEARRAQRRFRHDPQCYLRDLESELFKLALPP